MKLSVMHLWPSLTDNQKAELSEKMLRAFEKWLEQRAVDNPLKSQVHKPRHKGAAFQAAVAASHHKEHAHD